MAVPWYEDILEAHVHESPGSLFDSPDGSALIRMSTLSVMQWLLSLSTNYIASDACNCMGVWGSGIANDFRQRASGSDTAHSVRLTKLTINLSYSTPQLMSTTLIIAGPIFRFPKATKSVGLPSKTPATSEQFAFRWERLL